MLRYWLVFKQQEQSTCALVINFNWVCATLFYCGHLLFTWKTHCGLKFHFVQIDRSEIYTKESFTSPEAMCTLITKLLYTEVKFYPNVKSQTDLSSLRVSCKRALIMRTKLVRQYNLILETKGKIKLTFI